MISSLGINPHEAEAMFEGIETIVAKNDFVSKASKMLRRELDMQLLENKQLLAKTCLFMANAWRELNSTGYLA